MAAWLKISAQTVSRFVGGARDLPGHWCFNLAEPFGVTYQEGTGTFASYRDCRGGRDGFYGLGWLCQGLSAVAQTRQGEFQEVRVQQVRHTLADADGPQDYPSKRAHRRPRGRDRGQIDPPPGR